MTRRWQKAWIGAAIGLALLARSGPSLGAEPTGELNCAVSSELARLGVPLLRTIGRIAEGRTLTILAAGSSSTQGVGASNPAMSYPSRLEGELRQLFPTIEIKVINRGRRGQDAAEELAGLNQDLAASHPDLVVWQIGTNALLRRQDPSFEERLISEEVAEVKRQGVDVVLMDLQYAPRVLARKDWTEMERVIAAVSRHERVGYFRRFEIMREWDQRGQLASSTLIGPDGLHMTNVSYNCLAKQLARALTDQWQSQTKLAKSRERNPATIASGTHLVVGRPR
jgi:lysophospholipase L1-like esterase